MTIAPARDRLDAIVKVSVNASLASLENTAIAGRQLCVITEHPTVMVVAIAIQDLLERHVTVQFALKAAQEKAPLAAVA